MRVEGSTFPKATFRAIPVAVFAFVLKYLEVQGFVDLSGLDVLTQGSVYSGFGFVLGVSLVFRTSQSYLRYWTAATSVHEMGAEWADSCASLVAFALVSNRPRAEQGHFAHTVVTLFSLLHALALEELADIKNENFEVLGIDSFCREDFAPLMRITARGGDTGDTGGHRVHMVLGWIKLYIMRNIDSGILTLPPPILSRVFQELGMGLVEYHKAQQVVIWPFPYPYTQMNLVMLTLYMIITPLVICTWDTYPWLCSLVTCLSVTCMFGLESIAAELENPFGEDANDLPIHEMQHVMNRTLLQQLDPSTWKVPVLLSTSGGYLALANQARRISLREHYEETIAAPDAAPGEGLAEPEVEAKAGQKMSPFPSECSGIVEPGPEPTELSPQHLQTHHRAGSDMSLRAVSKAAELGDNGDTGTKTQARCTFEPTPPVTAAHGNEILLQELIRHLQQQSTREAKQLELAERQNHALLALARSLTEGRPCTPRDPPRAAQRDGDVAVGVASAWRGEGAKTKVGVFDALFGSHAGRAEGALPKVKVAEGALPPRPCRSSPTQAVEQVPSWLVADAA